MNGNEVVAFSLSSWSGVKIHEMIIAECSSRLSVQFLVRDYLNHLSGEHTNIQYERAAVLCEHVFSVSYY